MFSHATHRTPGSGRGGPVPFRVLWVAVREELSRRARASTQAADAAGSSAGAPADGAAAPAREGVAP